MRYRSVAVLICIKLLEVENKSVKHFNARHKNRYYYIKFKNVTELVWCSEELLPRPGGRQCCAQSVNQYD